MIYHGRCFVTLRPGCTLVDTDLLPQNMMILHIFQIVRKCYAVYIPYLNIVTLPWDHILCANVSNVCPLKLMPGNLVFCYQKISDPYAFFKNRTCLYFSPLLWSHPIKIFRLLAKLEWDDCFDFVGFLKYK